MTIIGQQKLNDVSLLIVGTTLLLAACAVIDDESASQEISSVAVGPEPAAAPASAVDPPPEERPSLETRPATEGPTTEPATRTQEMDEPTRTVLLIPGTTITGDFYDEMAARLQADGFDPVVYEPPDLFTESLALGAERISDVVRTVLQETGEERLHIVAECDGGIATRYYLQVLGGHTAVDQVVTFVSAHNGTWTSPIGAWFTDWQALYDIIPGSPFMETLSAAPFPEGLSLTSIYTCNDEFLWPYTTSEVEGATNVLFCDYTIKHFDGFWDPVVYDRILAALEGRGDDAPTYY